MHKEYAQTADQVLSDLQSGPEGLSAAQADGRLAEYGPNRLREAPKATLLQRFLQQLRDPMLLILMAAAAVSAVTNYLSHEPFTEVLIILAVVLLNAVLGVIQESKAEAAIEALQTMTAATSKVLRDGAVAELESSRLVPGDVVLLEAGDAVPADGRLLTCASLQIEEAALTGESVPSAKSTDPLTGDVPLGDRRNMAYMGSTVSYGRGRMVVTATGMDTEMGKIAGVLARTEQEETPLQKKLTQLGKTLSWLVLGICVFIFVFDLLVAGDFSLSGILKTFMVAVSLAVAAIPEGLATVVTVVLSIGVTRMSRRNAVIRRLTAVETLGCTQVICSDKTGTLTQNKMTVVDHTGDAGQLAAAMALCSDAVQNPDGTVRGEPTEAALVSFAAQCGLPKPRLEQDSPRIAEAPFDSGRKMMSVVVEEADGSFEQYTKGAPDVILNLCTQVYEDGKIVPMTDAKRDELLAANKAMADEALRVLALASRTYDAKPTDFSAEALENNLVFCGLSGMIDPERPEVAPAIKEAHGAGIRTVMITGDHIDTAVAIAKNLGICEDASQAITGAQLDAMSEEQLSKVWKRLIDHEIDILVCTTIIETGVDVSNCNTLIIEDADKLGLSQLYQIRGRVGRSSRRAFAYLTVTKGKALTDVATKRLEAIREFTTFGSGFRIAMRDLEIRGAGNLLGQAQSGHMEAVGYDLYCKMLNEAVLRLKGELKDEDEFDTTLDLDINAFIPSTYVYNEYQKLELYKRISSIESKDEMEDMTDELIDRFGEMPKAVYNLLYVAYLKSLAHHAYMTDVKQKGEKVSFEMKPDAAVDVEKIPAILEEYKRELSFQAGKNPTFVLDLSKTKKVKQLEKIEHCVNSLNSLIIR